MGLQNDMRQHYRQEVVPALSGLVNSIGMTQRLVNNIDCQDSWSRVSHEDIKSQCEALKTLIDAQLTALINAHTKETL